MINFANQSAQSFLQTLHLNAGGDPNFVPATLGDFEARSGYTLDQAAKRLLMNTTLDEGAFRSDTQSPADVAEVKAWILSQLASPTPSVVMPAGATGSIGYVAGMSLNVKQQLGVGLDTVQAFIEEHPVAAGATALGLAGAVAATVATVAAVTSKSKRKSSKKRKAKPRKAGKKRKSRLKFGSPAWRKKYQRKGRRKGKKHYGSAKQYRRKGGKAVKYTAKGQPYIILANGKARFVKK